MGKLKIVIYCSAFNLIQNKFDYDSALTNFCAFADEVVVAVNTSTDNTLAALKQWKSLNSKITIIETNFNRNNSWFDGLVKNAALQACNSPNLVQLDLDERIPVQNRKAWENALERLNASKYDCYSIPSLDLWGDKHSIRWDNKNNVKCKFYIHKPGFCRRPIKEAVIGNKLDSTKSDGCELCDRAGNLAKVAVMVPTNGMSNSESYFNWMRNSGLYVFHLGYLDFAARLLRDNNFWREQWKIEGSSDKCLNFTQMLATQTIRHNLPLWD